jgi:hypothetical protein
MKMQQRHTDKVMGRREKEENVERIQRLQQFKRDQL